MYDIIFISHDEINANENFARLKDRFPLLKRVVISDNIYTAFEQAVKKSFTKMFWIVWGDDLQVVDTFNFDYKVPEWDQKFIHVFRNGEYYDGVCLVPKLNKITGREITNRFFINKKEIDVVASTPNPYDRYYINTHEEYLEALSTSKTNMFWVIFNDLKVLDTFNFEYQVPNYNQHITHIFKNGEYYDGVCLFSKNTPITKREFDNRFFINKKEIDVVASEPVLYDIVFISYHEEFADSNFEKLKYNLPHRNIYRINGIVGIHNAHIEAAKLSTTNMFWVVDADAEIINDFEFNYQVPFFNQNMVHVWRSQNPITNLEYGYGGVKLFPKKLTIDMKTDTMDMTMNISDKFKVMDTVSNITAFNTDDYSTWRSSFRECCKLAVTNNPESLSRLNVWCTLNENAKYGFYAYLGALSGKNYGEKNASNPEALNKINDFTWLKDQWLMEKSQLSL